MRSHEMVKEDTRREQGDALGSCYGGSQVFLAVTFLRHPLAQPFTSRVERRTSRECNHLSSLRGLRSLW